MTINEGSCDCQYLEWDDPVVLVEAVLVDFAEDLTIPTPVPDSDTNKAVYPTFKKCYDDGTDCSEDGRFAVISDIELDGVTLTEGQWITFTPIGSDEDYDASTQ